MYVVHPLLFLFCLGFVLPHPGQIPDISRPSGVEGVCKLLKNARKGQLLFVPCNPSLEISKCNKVFLSLFIHFSFS